MQTDRELWALSDGRAGNETQALGLAEALARLRPARVIAKRIVLRRWAALIPPALSRQLGTSLRSWPFIGLAEGAETLCPPWPDAVIGAGRRVAPFVAALKRLHGMAAVQILDPRMPPSTFDALVVPEHDRSGVSSNCLQSVGAINRLTEHAIAEAAAPWAAKLGALPKPRLAVMVGGASRSAGFTETTGRNLVLVLQSLGARHGLIVTGSRRTPAGLMERIKASLGEGAFVWDGSGENPYPGLLAHADAVMVTEDSVNMASEAATAGLPVHVFPVSSVGPKIARFHAQLRMLGASRPFSGEIGLWRYRPLAEADRIAGELVRRGVL